MFKPSRIVAIVLLSMYLLPSTIPVSANTSSNDTIAQTINVSGTWTGYITQEPSPERYPFILELSQNGTNITGTSSTLTPAVFIALTGTFDGHLLHTQETRIVGGTSPGGPSPGKRWCIKTADLTYLVDNDGETLEGPWTEKFPGCLPGKISVKRDIPKTNSWTVMVYIDGDNNLETTYKEMYQAFDRLKVNEGITVVALWDGTAANDTEYKVITSTGSRRTSAGGEYNMGSPQSLARLYPLSRQKRNGRVRLFHT